MFDLKKEKKPVLTAECVVQVAYEVVPAVRWPATKHALAPAVAPRPPPGQLWLEPCAKCCQWFQHTGLG
jgi:hypothetical protein